MKARFIAKGSPMTCTHDKVYEVLSIEYGWYRVIDDTDEDYMYPAENFKIIDPNPPAPVLM